MWCACCNNVQLFFKKNVSKVSFNEPSCCRRFAETASFNLVLERLVLFFKIDDFKYKFIFIYITVSQVIFNIGRVIFSNIYETFALS